VRLFSQAGGCVTPTLRKPLGQVLARRAGSPLRGESACRGASFSQAVRERQALPGQGCVATAKAQSAAGPHVIGGREAPLEAKISVEMRRNAAADRSCKTTISLAALFAPDAGCHGLPGFRRWLQSTRFSCSHSSVLTNHGRLMSTPCAAQGDVRPRILLFAGPLVSPSRPT